jgi:hypothetical protein
MATDLYTGPQGGDWFDPANWSNGQVPGNGDVAQIFGPVGPGNSDPFNPVGVNALAGTISGLTIDLSTQPMGSYYLYGNTGVVYGFDPSLIAKTIGTESAPVTIDITADSGPPSFANILVDTLDGQLALAAGQGATIAPLPGGSVTVDGAITINPNAILSFKGYTDPNYTTAPVDLNGHLLVNGGSLFFDSGNVGGTGSIEVENGGTVTLQAYTTLTVDSAITFDPSGGTLVVNQQGDDYAGTISGFGTGDTIIAYDSGATGDPISVQFDNGELTVTQDADTFRVSLAGNYDSQNFTVTDNGYGFDITYAPCFATGTLIETETGPAPVETLAPGHRITLATGGHAPVVWLGHRRQRNGQVIRIRAHAFAPNQPARDLIVSADHGMLVDGVLVQAGLLVNAETIVSEPRADVTFWHVELQNHAILLAENAPAETYLDTGNRAQFGNCPLAYDPIDATRDPCVEMVFAGPRLDAIRRRLTPAMV